MQKLKSVSTYLLIGVILPLVARPSAFGDVRIYILMLGVILVILTQPTMDLQEAKANSSSDKHSFWWIYAMSLIALLAPVLEWAYWNDLAIQYSWSFLFGLALLGLGIGLRVWAIQVLGRFFTATVQIVEQHQLVMKGPYALVRHPSYTGAYLSYIATGILFEAWIGIIIAALGMGWAYYKRIQAEEATLVQHFGEAYRAYSSTTKRLFPFLF